MSILEKFFPNLSWENCERAAFIIVYTAAVIVLILDIFVWRP